MPSTVVTSMSSACTAKIKQDRTASPSSSTVHAPHAPCSQPRWVPVSPQCSRKKSASVTRGSTVPSVSCPLTQTRTVRSCIDGLRARLVGCCSPGARHQRGTDFGAVRDRPLQVGGNVVEPGHRQPADVVCIHLTDRPADDGGLGL